MQRIGGFRIVAVALAWGALLPGASLADTASTSTTAGPSPTVSSVGLLPVHAVAVDLDALPGMKGKKDDVAALQQVWDSFLKGAGFNVVEFEVDVHDLGADGAGRVARLCTWAKQNNVRLAPTLVGAEDGKPLPDDYGKLAASFVGKVIATLGPQALADYSQIVFYQLDNPLNQPASHGAIDAAAAGTLLKTAAEEVRAAETAGLSAAGVQPSPLLVPASFDYELVRRGALAPAPVADDVYEQAYGGLRDYLVAVFGSAAVEAAAVQWYPGSVSSGGVERLADLVTRLQAELPGKMLLVDTGYSSAAGSDTAQARYYQLALNNLCDLRARQGVDSPFAGIIWHSAVDGRNADASPVAPPPASEVAKALADPKADAKEARSWLRSVQSHFGLLARAKDDGAGLAPKTAYRVMSGLENALAQSPQASDALAAVKELSAASKTGGVGQAVKSRIQTAMFGLLDAWLTKTADNLFATPQESAPAAPGLPMSLPDVQILDPGTVPDALTAGTPVHVQVTLFNAGTAMANDAAVYLRAENPGKQLMDLVHTTTPVAIPPNGQTTIDLTWIPAGTGEVQKVAAEVFCSNDADASSNRHEYGNRHVSASNTGGGGTKPPRHFDTAILGSRALVMAEGSKGSSGTGGGTTSGGSKTGGATSGTPVGGATRSGAPSSGGGTVRSLTLSTQSGAGFATIDAVTAPQVMMAPAPSGSQATATTARSITGSPAPAAPAFAAQPVTVTVTNPFPMVFANVVATLRVDDAVVASKPIGYILPRQSRTIAFTGWTPPHPGTYRIRTDLAGVDTFGKPRNSSASSTVTVSAQGTPSSAGAPTPVATRAIAPTRSFTPLVATVSSMPVRPFGAAGFGGAGVRSIGGAPVAPMLSANQIQLRPFPCPEGQPVAVSVQLVNLQAVPLASARVAVSVDNEALGEVAVDVPASGNATASGFREWTARSGRHDVHATVTVGSAQSVATKPMFVMPGGGRGPGLGFGRGAAGSAGTIPPAGATAGGLHPFDPGGAKPGLGLGRGLKGAGIAAAAAVDLQIAAGDIRITPASPVANAPMTVTMTVRNAGSQPVAEARVLAVLTAGGVEVARKEFSSAVGAAAAVSLTWEVNAPPGSPATVAVTVTAANDGNPANNQARAIVVGRPRTLTPRSTIGTTR